MAKNQVGRRCGNGLGIRVNQSLFIKTVFYLIVYYGNSSLTIYKLLILNILYFLQIIVYITDNQI